LQVFNEFNARKPDQINVFKGVTKNRLFMGIVGFTVILQVSSRRCVFFLLSISVLGSDSAIANCFTDNPH